MLLKALLSYMLVLDGDQDFWQRVYETVNDEELKGKESVEELQIQIQSIFEAAVEQDPIFQYLMGLKKY